MLVYFALGNATFWRRVHCPTPTPDARYFAFWWNIGLKLPVRYTRMGSYEKWCMQCLKLRVGPAPVAHNFSEVCTQCSHISSASYCCYILEGCTGKLRMHRFKTCSPDGRTKKILMLNNVFVITYEMSECNLQSM